MATLAGQLALDARRHPDRVALIFGDRERTLDECLRTGEQWVRQRKLASEESVSLELFRPAMRLAQDRDLLGPGGPELNERRTAFVEEVRAVTNRLALIADLARVNGATE